MRLPNPERIVYPTKSSALYMAFSAGFRVQDSSFGLLLLSRDSSWRDLENHRGGPCLSGFETP